MKRVLGRVYRRLPGRWQQGIKSFFWTSVVSMDDTLQRKVALEGTATNGTNRAAAVDNPVDQTTRDGGDIGTVHVVNDRDWFVSSRDDATLLVTAVFGTESLTGAAADALQNVLNRPDCWVSPELVIKRLRDYLTEQLETSTAERSQDVAACLAKVFAHQQVALANQRAYSTEGKTFPNAVFWPNPAYPKAPRSLFTEIPIATTKRFITKSTAIGSAGSCFAMEIAHRLQADGYNYVITEPHPGRDGLSNSCARWGIIFNTPSFRQLVEKAFGLRETPKLLWSRVDDGVTQLLDPFREDIVFHSVDEYRANYYSHLTAARQAFERAEVFVFTLGMNEVWRLKANGAVLSRAPWRISNDLVEHGVMTAEENVAELELMLSILRRFNPSIKIIVSVSPVPLHATFRGGDQHIIAANCHSKSVLRVAAEEFVRRNRDVYYFPSYESVMYCTENAWEADQRHVSRAAVDRVMSMFREMFVKEE